MSMDVSPSAPQVFRRMLFGDLLNHVRVQVRRKDTAKTPSLNSYLGLSVETEITTKAHDDRNGNEILGLQNRSGYTGCNRRNGPDFGRVFLR